MSSHASMSRSERNRSEVMLASSYDKHTAQDAPEQRSSVKSPLRLLSGDDDMAEDGRSRLGRGLAALIGDVGEETKVVERAPRRAQGADRIRQAQSAQPAPQLFRRRARRARGLDQASAASSSRSWCARCKGANDQFEIVAGERRWRAAQRAGLHEVPIVIVEVTDAEALELAIIENVQRADLNPLEEAMGYQSLIDRVQPQPDDVAKFVGKSRSHVTNTLRLLQLPDSVKALINSGQLTAGHARMLVGQPNADELARDIVSRGLNVRQVEALARRRTARRRRRQARASRARTPTPWRWSGACPTRSGSMSPSSTAAKAASCTSRTATSSSWKTCCAGWSGT